MGAIKWIILHQDRHFKCRQCSFFAKTKDNLLMHTMSIHPQGQNIYKCDICDYKTNWKCALQKHVNKHQISYVCYICHKKFSYCASLDRHLKACHQSNPRLYKCQICSFNTKWSGNLNKHVNTAHKNKDQ